MTATKDPYRRLQDHGFPAAHVADLIAVIAARRPEDVESLFNPAATLAGRGLPRMLDLSPADFEALAGLTTFESHRILAAIELGRRAAIAERGPRSSIQTPGDVISLFEHIRTETREHFCVAFLNTKNEVLSVKVMHVGTLDTSLVGAREIFRDAVREGAAAIVVAHNHPSGDSTPSPQDISVTQTLVEAGKLLDIDVLDHVVIGREKDVSLRERGLM
ncbi:MAG: hypothetical protein HONBIEJF_02755 [Fimbriimonadaceae bacterium]|nr:hypothetical protein [Fimbriimonadaceae bacterium]